MLKSSLKIDINIMMIAIAQLSFIPLTPTDLLIGAIEYFISLMFQGIVSPFTLYMIAKRKSISGEM